MTLLVPLGLAYALATELARFAPLGRRTAATRVLFLIFAAAIVVAFIALLPASPLLPVLARWSAAGGPAMQTASVISCLVGLYLVLTRV